MDQLHDFSLLLLNSFLHSVSKSKFMNNPWHQSNDVVEPTTYCKKSKKFYYCRTTALTISYPDSVGVNHLLWCTLQNLSYSRCWNLIGEVMVYEVHRVTWIWKTPGYHHLGQGWAKFWKKRWYCTIRTTLREYRALKIFWITQKFVRKISKNSIETHKT